MADYNIAGIPGDGTGPECVKQARKVLDVATRKHGLDFDYHWHDFGGERFLRTGETLPDSALEELRDYDDSTYDELQDLIDEHVALDKKKTEMILSIVKELDDNELFNFDTLLVHFIEIAKKDSKNFDEIDIKFLKFTQKMVVMYHDFWEDDKHGRV